MSELYAISFENFNRLVSLLVKSADVYGPVKRKVTSYEKIQDASELYFDSLTEYTAKGLFFKPGELILTYRNNNAIAPELLSQQQAQQRKKILLGLRMCDLAAIKKQDIAFGAEPADPYYAKRRKNTLLFGYHQKQCGDEWCFCQSVDMDVSYDLMFYKRYDHYLAETGSENGRRIIRQFRKCFDSTDYKMTDDDRRINNQMKLSSTEIAAIYDNHGWQKLAEACISCGVCNALCPTCYCFEFRDKRNPDGSFERTREQSQCQLLCFTQVAGGFAFRSQKLDRFRHRIYHQLQYFREKSGETLCVGCGRCIRHCPAKIDFVTGINKMKEEQSGGSGGR